MSSYSDKQIILITGATNGIGLDTAILLSSTPTNHIILGARNANKAETKLREIQSKNSSASLSILELDVDSDDSIASATAQLTKDFPRIDVLINNAGICPEAMDAQFPTRAELRSTFETNVYGPTLLTSALLPLLQKSSAAKIINVTSGLGAISTFDATLPADSPLHNHKTVKGAAYRMSKSALNMLSAYTQYQLGDKVKVWAYCPGYVVTDLTNDREAREVNPYTETSWTSAEGIEEVLSGKRDKDVGGFVTKYGGGYGW
jgi:NAD(P)-dependent dehydrogenase (short-subunit alcohol dehydrogenase family)